MPPGIPVYCWGDPGEETFEMGTSQVVPKAPAGAVKDFLIPNTQKPLNKELDWADALFGYAEEGKAQDGEQALQGRLSFDFARIDNAEEACAPDEAFVVTQGQPKASFDPFYLKKKKASGGPAVWAKRDNAQLSGYKRYPACRPLDMPSKAKKLREYDLKSVESFVRPLKKGAVCRASVEFHNLHPLELGALLWALSFGDPAVFTGGETRFRHVAGRLRNRGLGRLRPANARLAMLEQNPMPEELEWQSLCADETSLALALMQAFEAHMGHFMDEAAADDEAARQAFYESDTITALLNSSDAEWDARAHGHDAQAMFHIPDNDDRFRYFNNLRRLHYKKFFKDDRCERGREREILPGEGKTTILDEFLIPEGGPEQGPFQWPESVRKCQEGTGSGEKEGGLPDTWMSVFLNPLAELRKWHERQSSNKKDS